MDISVYCSFQIVGFHCWPKAPDNVAYLRNSHRHVFHFKVYASVQEQDREIEFHTLRNKCVNAVGEHVGNIQSGFVETDSVDFEHQSCEHIAVKLATILLAYNEQYSRVTVEVSEDGENGAVVTVAQ